MLVRRDHGEAMQLDDEVALQLQDIVAGLLCGVRVVEFEHKRF